MAFKPIARMPGKRPVSGNLDGMSGRCSATSGGLRAWYQVGTSSRKPAIHASSAIVA